MNVATPNNMSLVGKRSGDRPVDADDGFELVEYLCWFLIHGPIGLRCRSSRRATAFGRRPLPRALADVVADRVSEDAGKRVALGQALGLGADHDGQLAFASITFSVASRE